jgi:hypothetical protein
MQYARSRCAAAGWMWGTCEIELSTVCSDIYNINNLLFFVFRRNNIQWVYRRKEKTNPRERRGCEKIRENMLSINLQLGKFSMTSAIGSQT